VDQYTLHYETSFKQNEDGTLLLEYISAKQYFEVNQPGKPSNKVETQSLFTVYEYYLPEKKNRRLGGKLRFDKSDQSRINKVEYDPQFWEENPIVKRTPVENEVIESFRKNRRFGSIFLNNKNQVSFMPELDSDPFIKRILKRMNEKVPRQEKIYVHLDKPYYAGGDTIWFKAYLVDAISHQWLGKSGFINIELINPEGDRVVFKRLEVHSGGQAWGDISLDPNLFSGTYQIRAYTQRMQKFDPAFLFTAEIEIYSNQENATKPQPELDFEVNFFPEGGELVYGLPSQLAFKAIDQAGRGISLTGTIIDDSGKVVTKISSENNGMGSTFIIPRKGVKYSVEVISGGKTKQLSLPKPLVQGFVMSVTKKGSTNTVVRVLGSPDKEGNEVYLLAQMRGKLFYKGKGTLKNQILNFEIPNHLFPSGILHLTLFDTLERAFCERILFIDQEDQFNINIKSNRAKYKAREKIELDIVLKDAFGNPVQADISVAVSHLHFV